MFIKNKSSDNTTNKIFAGRYKFLPFCMTVFDA